VLFTSAEILLDSSTTCVLHRPRGTLFSTLFMFFTLGMTADAAAAHRHEFSTPPIAGRQSASPAPNTSAVAPQSSPGLSPVNTATISLPFLGSWRPVSAGSTPGPQSFEAILDGEAGNDTTSDGGFSGTSSNDTAVRTKLRKVDAKIRTSFQIAHPAPVVRHKQRLKIRPKLLLQLQQLSGSSRPTPALDVLPFVLFAPRFAQKFPRMCKGKDGHGPNDLAIVSSEAYESSPTTTSEKHDDSEEASWDHREIVATIRQLKKEEGGACGKVEISLNHGSLWEATPLLNGGYEFVAKEGPQTVARWVPRRPSQRRRSDTLQSASTNRLGQEERKFNFSIVNPNTRRHPIIASITRSTIDILDRYGSPSTTLASPLRSPSNIRSSHSGSLEDAEVQPHTMIETDEQLRTLIVVTGIWVVFRENWSQNFHYHDAMSVPLPSSNASSQPSNRTLSLNSGNGAKTSTNSQEGLSSHSALHHLGGMVRQTGTQLLHRSTATAGRFPAQDLQPRRAHSTGTAFMESVQIMHSRGRSATSNPGLDNHQPTMASPHSQGQSAKHRRGNNTIANDSATHSPSSSCSGSTVNSEDPRRAGEGDSPTDESSRSDTVRQPYDRGYSMQGNHGKPGGARKGMGKLHQLFNIVRRTSSTQH